MDREFEKIRRIMPGISNLNTTVAAENVIEIEIQIRVIKERNIYGVSCCSIKYQGALSLIQSCFWCCV